MSEEGKIKPQTRSRLLKKTNQKPMKCLKCGKLNVFEKTDNRMCSLCSDHLLAIKIAQEFEKRPTRSKLKAIKSNVHEHDLEPKAIKLEATFNGQEKLNSYKSSLTSSVNLDCSDNQKTATNPKKMKVYLASDLSTIEFPCELGSFRVSKRSQCGDFYYTIGDIVSVKDNNEIYYAQIKIILVDQFCEKHAALIWLLPSSSSPLPKCGFDPDTYTYGPQDEQLYNLRYLRFEMHAPSNYYRRFISPIPEDSNIIHPVRYKCKLRRKL